MSGLPLISCIMPTANRRAFVPQAIQCFLRQDYPEKELVILDDGEDSVADLIPDDPHIRYLREVRRRSVGAKRNALCEEARGNLIAHWDDDDWYPNDRLSRQARCLDDLAGPIELCGSSRLYFLRHGDGGAWEYRYDGLRRPYLVGSSLVYRRTSWQRSPFPDRQKGEDALFVWGRPGARVADLADASLGIASIHPDNTSAKRPQSGFWRPVDAAPLRQMMAAAEALEVWPAGSAAQALAPPAERRPGLTAVVPHSGDLRLPQLAASLANLVQCPGIDEVVVVELGNRAYARAAAARWRLRYVFVRHDGPFERARALNIGTAVAGHDLVLWKDNDLLLPDDFAARARAETLGRGLDFLIPYQRIHYLGEADTAAVMRGTRDPADCRPVEVWRGGISSGGAGIVRADFIARVGGLDQAFRDWGCEDTAWWHKARLLGRTGVTADAGQVLYHLHHPRAVYDQRLFAANHQRLRHTQGIRSAAAFFAQFPPPPLATCPWPVEQRLLILAEAAQVAAARAIAAGLRVVYGIAPETRTFPDDTAIPATPPDALVVIGDAPARRLLGRPEFADLAPRTLILADAPAPSVAGAAPGPAPCPRLERLAGGARRWTAPGLLAGPRSAGQLTRAIVAPLSEVFGEPDKPPDDPTEPVVWSYWEGPCPPWIAACLKTIETNAPRLRRLDPASFDALRAHDRDIDLGRLAVAHRADFIRAYLLAHHGGLWLDADCLLMRPPTEVFDRLAVVDFVAHRDRQGWFPNGFMAARPGSRIARSFYDRVCERLRTGAPLGWTSLGGQPLTEILRGTEVPWSELPCEQVQPVCWSAPGTFFERRPQAEHELAFDPRALCYMLSNTEVNKYLAQHPGEDLLADDSFFAFLNLRALAAPKTVPPAATLADSLAALPLLREALEILNPHKVLQFGTDNVLWPALVREWWGRRPDDGFATRRLDGASLSEPGAEVRGLDLFDQVQPVPDDAEPPGPRYELALVPPGANPDAAASLRRALSTADYVLVAGDLEVPVAGPVTADGRMIRDDDAGGALLSRDDPRRLARPSRAGVVFERWYGDALARGDESVSGPGSSLGQTAELRRRLPLLLQTVGVCSLLDAPCGDFNWMGQVRLGVDCYIGVDCVAELIERNRARHGRPGRAFERVDILRGPLPRADLILCRDFLVHLAYADLRRALRAMCRSGARWLLTTTFPGTDNTDIETGDWRPIDLQRPPFGFPAPLALINEKCTEAGGRYAHKSLGLWAVSQLTDPLG